MTLQKRPPLASGMLGLYRGDSGIIAIMEIQMEIIQWLCRDYSSNGESN